MIYVNINIQELEKLCPEVNRLTMQWDRKDMVGKGGLLYRGDQSADLPPQGIVEQLLTDL